MIDLNYIFYWLVGCSCGVSLLNIRGFEPDQKRAWTTVCGALLTLLAVGGLVAPHRAGLVVGALWFLTVVLPLLLMRACRDAIVRENPAKLRNLLATLKLVHPFEYVEHLREPRVQERIRHVARQHVTAVERPLVTYVTCGIIVFAFLFQLANGRSFHGRFTVDSLYAMGALVPMQPAVDGSEWWRIVTANLLHINLLHVSLNLLGLYILGSDLERRLGHLRCAVCLIAGGTGAMAGIVAVTALDLWRTGGMVVGASGAVLGLVGALTVVLFRDWRRTRDPRVLARLRVYVLNIALQMIFDANTAEVSMSAHSIGMAIGAVMGTVLWRPEADSRVRGIPVGDGTSEAMPRRYK